MAKKQTAKKPARRAARTGKTPARRITPAQLYKRVTALAMNLQWTWNHDAKQLFASLDPVIWESTNHNPFKTLKQLPDHRVHTLCGDGAFLAALEQCEKTLEAYMAAKPWFAKNHRGKAAKLQVAYFCAEYAIHEAFQQYSGGLGVLAGDHLKSASDLGAPLVAVGLLYRSGFYIHEFNADGTTRCSYPHYDFGELPVVDTRKTVRVRVGPRDVTCKLWTMQVGRTPVVLLDTDVPTNHAGDRGITDKLYSGDAEHRIRQELILGVGGCRALEKLGYKPTVFHLNEGHAVFANVERLAGMLKGRTRFETALEKLRAGTVFTTHTPVPAGNEWHDPKLIAKYLAPQIKALGLTPDEFLEWGREDAADKKQWFCMTIAALNLAEHCNAVAKLHGETSRTMWMNVFGAKKADDVPIGYVTNGVHAPTWTAAEMEPLLTKYLKPNRLGGGPRDGSYQKADRIPDAELWRVRGLMRRRMVHFVRQRLLDQARRHNAPQEALLNVFEILDPDALTIGFARRFATYKRAPLIFKDAKRLERILSDGKRPVQLIFAGKAHPADGPGQKFAQEIFKHAQSARFKGRVVILENYDMRVGHMLTSGCDVWLNNPVRPMEASGTSGMKPTLHGGLNLSVLDGWWPEGYDGKNGWAIGDGRELKSQAAQDKYDATCIYELLEKRVVPLFYKRNRAGVPTEWVKWMKRSMKTCADDFTSHRMVGDYVEGYYLPAHGV